MDCDDLRTALSEFDGDVEVVIRLPGEKFMIWPIDVVEHVQHDGKTLAAIYC